ncbi:DUF4115 domain-containing protein [Selenomonadales bacterium OttesenSCG-928-I06]|nr:DUF4115 domain-containing protein [Selenomonadales bacterium OttesenSCG-928-I06]
MGELLREVREAKGITLKDVENDISIRVLYLQSIEDGNYDVIPGEVYLKGFIRNYSVYLGLDPAEIMEIYKQSKPIGSKEEANFKLENNSKESSFQRKKLAKAQQRRRISNIGIVVIILVVALLVGGFMYWNNRTPEQPIQDTQQITTEQQNTTSSAINEENTNNIPSNTNNSAISSNNNSIKVVINFTDKSWTEVTVDGDKKYEGLSEANTTLSFEGSSKIFVKVGNAGAVNLTYNGENLGTAGEVGEVVVKTFTKDSVASVEL